MPLPRIDVILPVLGARRTLPHALGDVLAQRDVAVRVLAVLDLPAGGAPDDGTAEWLHAAARRDRRIEVIAGSGAGVAAALEAGLAAVRSPLLSHMEADDRCPPDRLARLHAALAGHGAGLGSAGRGTPRDAPPPDAVVSRAAQFGARTPGMRRYLDWQNGLLAHEEMARERFVEIPALHQTGLYRTAAVRAAGGYRTAGPWPADIDFWMRWFEPPPSAGAARSLRGDAGAASEAAAGAGVPGLPRRVVKLPRVLYRWRQHARQQTRGGESHDLPTLRACKACYFARLHGPRGLVPREIVLVSIGGTLEAWTAALAAAGATASAALSWSGRSSPPPAVREALARSAALAHSADSTAGAPLLLAAYGNPVARGRVRATLAHPREPESLLFTA